MAEQEEKNSQFPYVATIRWLTYLFQSAIVWLTFNFVRLLSLEYLKNPPLHSFMNLIDIYMPYVVMTIGFIILLVFLIESILLLKKSGEYHG